MLIKFLFSGAWLFLFYGGRDQFNSSNRSIDLHINKRVPTMNRTYGNWRRPKSNGLGSLGILSTVYLFIGTCCSIIAITKNSIAGLISIAVFGVTFLPFIVRVYNGRSLVEVLYIYLLWRRAKNSGENIYRSSILSFSRLDIKKSSCTLPGIASNLELFAYKSGKKSYIKEDFVLLYSKATNHYTIVFQCDPNGLAPIDNDQIDVYVANWGRWLNSLSYEKDILGASVVVQCAKDFAKDFKDNLDDIVADKSPEFSVRVMEDIKEQYSSNELYRANTWITVTYLGYDSITRKKISSKKMFSKIEGIYYNLKNSLSSTGAGIVRPVQEQDLVKILRSAYDPSSQEFLENLSKDDESYLSFKDAGPIAHQEFWDHYVHDSGISSSWVMREAPRGVVYSNVLNGIFRESKELFSKRFAIHYRNFSLEESSRIVEQNKRRAMQQVAEDKKRKAKNILEYRSAEQNAFEEAQGANLIRFSIVFTATVLKRDKLSDIERFVDGMSGVTRMRFSKAYGSQSAVFLSSLPLGINLQNYASAPYILMRDSI